MAVPTPEKLLEALDPDQRAVALHVSGPLAVRAGAGTGKTRAITYRIAYGVATGTYNARNVLAVTFTSKAAAEMRERLLHLDVPGVVARTFHAAAFSQLRFFWPNAIGGQVPMIASSKASLVFAAAPRIGLTNIDKDMVFDIAAEIEWAKVSMVPVEAYASTVEALKRPIPAGLTVTQMENMLDAYEDAKEERDVIDFEDVLLLMAGILQERDDIAARVRSQYRHFVVDEYQDVSKLQQHLLKLWLGDRRDLCVVGDAAQTIYSFAGASADYLLDFASTYRGARVIELNRDYRSTPQIVSIANELISAGSSVNGRKDYVHLVSQRPDGAAVRFYDYDHDDAQALGIVQRIQDLQIKGVSPADIAVLYRTNSQSVALEWAFERHNVPYKIQDGQAFVEKDIIRRAVILLEQIAKRGQETPLRLLDAVQQAFEVLKWTPNPPAERGKVRDQWEDLNTLLTLAQQSAELSIAEFIESLQSKADAGGRIATAGVTFSTIHGAKGREWDYVFLIGLSEGLLPISHAKTSAEIEEERRLLYVGITRARIGLELSWARAKNSSSKGRSRTPSRFLKDISVDGEPVKRRVTSQPKPQTSAAKRRVDAEEFIEQADPATAHLYEELVKWRNVVAREASIPAYSVWTNATLQDIATVKPRTLKQLRVIRGVGDVKLERFGAAVLKVVRNHAMGTGGDAEPAGA